MTISTLVGEGKKNSLFLSTTKSDLFFLKKRRICPGIYLAEMETFVVFVELMSRCFIEPSEDGMPNIDKAENSGIVISPYPYKVKFTKRQ